MKFIEMNDRMRNAINDYVGFEMIHADVDRIVYDGFKDGNVTVTARENTEIGYYEVLNGNEGKLTATRRPLGDDPILSYLACVDVLSGKYDCFESAPQRDVIREKALDVIGYLFGSLELETGVLDAHQRGISVLVENGGRPVIIEEN